jgi:hypothetical protein
VPYLSIIDILMFNSKDEIKNMLVRYELVWKNLLFMFRIMEQD